MEIKKDSDDRLKEDETPLSGATTTLMKLRPVSYRRYQSMNAECTGPDLSSNSGLEFGLIAQDIYTNTPELRRIVSYPPPTPLDLSNIGVDPSGADYESYRDDPRLPKWGTDTLAVGYNGLIPWLIQGFQEQQQVITTQQATISDLTTKLADITAVVDKLKAANSFDEFKATL